MIELVIDLLGAISNIMDRLENDINHVGVFSK